MARGRHPKRRRALTAVAALACVALGAALLALLGRAPADAPPEPPRAHASGLREPGRDLPPRRFERGREDEGARERAAERTLSNELTRSRWAYVRRPTVARSEPSAGAPALGSIDLETSIDTPELVLALAERRAEDGERWVEVRLPIRPGGRTGWVRRRDLGRYYVVTTALRIDRARRVATLYDRGDKIWEAEIGIGRLRWPTPAGHFYVRSRIVPVDAGGGFDRGGVYGVFAFGTSAYAPGLSDWPGGGEIGIHGTNRPEQLPGRVSHGCVRLRNRDIARLRELMPLGTPIEVL